MTAPDPNQSAPDPVLLLVAWAWALLCWLGSVLQIALAGLGLVFVIGYLLQSCGRSIIHF